MFNFDQEEDGSEARFHQRVRIWKGEEPFDPNMVSAAPNPETFTINPHPVIGIAPVKPAFDFHDWTSRKLNGL